MFNLSTTSVTAAATMAMLLSVSAPMTTVANEATTPEASVSTTTTVKPATTAATTKSAAKGVSMNLNGHKITNCAGLIKYYRPKHLPKKQKFTFKCVNRMPKGKSNTLAYISFYTQNKGAYAFGPYTIVILNKTNVPEMKNSFDHEAWHALSYSWSKKKQAAYLKSLKAKSWTQGNVYKKMPAERWAWAATACYTTYAPYKVKADMNLIPGGCKGVRYWINRKG